MTIQPYHHRLRLVPAKSAEGVRIANEIKAHQRRANASRSHRSVRPVPRAIQEVTR